MDNIFFVFKFTWNQMRIGGFNLCWDSDKSPHPLFWPQSGFDFIVGAAYYTAVFPSHFSLCIWYETQIKLTNAKIKMSKTTHLFMAIYYCGCGSFPPCKAKILASAISQLLEQDEKGLIYNVKQNIGRVVENRMMQEYQFKILIQYINWCPLLKPLGIARF